MHSRNTAPSASILLVITLAWGCSVQTPIGAEDAEVDGGRLDAGPCGLVCGAACCAPGESCNDGVCERERCALLCGPSLQCCGDAEECVGDRCLPACTGVRCGDQDETCCGDGELCIEGACSAPGARCVTDADCPAGAACEPLLGRCLPVPEGTECRYIPPVDTFEPVLEWEHTRAGVRSHPVVTQLNDDDGDGEITARDVPDIVVHTGELVDNTIVFDRRMWALSGDGSGELWRSQDGYKVCPESVPAIGDLDGDGTVEIATLITPADEPGACGGNLRGTDDAAPIHAGVFDHEGNLEWISATRINAVSGGGAVSRQPSVIADLDGDGDGEVIVNGHVFDHLGALLWSSPRLAVDGAGWGVAAATADIDGDGFLEVFGPDSAYRYDGTEMWRGGPVGQGGVAIANVVPSQPGPQLIVTGNRRYAVLDPATGDTIFGPLDTRSGLRIPHPVVADFDGDGQSELGVTSDNYFAIIDPVDFPVAPHVRWSVDTAPDVGRVGATVFDFDGDGQSEVILASYCHVRVLDGADGALLWHTSNTATNSSQYAVVADVDGDFNAELVLMSDFMGGADGPSTCRDDADLPYDANPPGLRVWGDSLDNWVATRRSWNQHGYHLDNVLDDGSITDGQEPRWSTHNTYRINQLPDPETATLSPNLTVTSLDADLAGCPDALTIKARVDNIGARGVAAGVPVTFYAGEPGEGGAALGTAHTDQILLAGDGAWVELTVPEPPVGMTGTIRVHVVVDDDGTGAGIHRECDESDNITDAVTIDCSGLI